MLPVNGRGGSPLECVDEDGQLTVPLMRLKAGLSGAEAEGGPPLTNGAVQPALYIVADRGGGCPVIAKCCGNRTRVDHGATVRLAGPRRLAALSAVLPLIAALPNTGWAFEYDEHRDLGNEAFELAAARHRGSARPAWASTSADGQTFGDIVASVDYTLQPSDFFEPPSAAIPRITGESASPSWAQVRKMRRDLQQFLFAAHMNRAHFQHAALYAYTFWHSHAIAVAASNDLSSALLFEAYALHFVQDFFAAGHVVTPRDNLPDIASRSLHNRYNREGLRFVPNERACSLLAELRKDSGVAAQCALSVKPEPFVTYGDGKLTASPQAREFLVLVCAKSIDDVLAAQETHSGQNNSFPSAEWNLAATEIEIKRAPTVRACLTVGCYDEEQLRRTRHYDNVIVPSLGWRRYVAGAQGQDPFEADVEFLLYGTIPPALGGLQWALVAGATALWGGNAPPAGGLHARAVVPLSRLGLQLSLQPGLQVAIRAEQIRYQPDAVLRVEGGFGVLFFGLGFGYSRPVTFDTTTTGGLYALATLSAEIPVPP